MEVVKENDFIEYSSQNGVANTKMTQEDPSDSQVLDHVPRIYMEIRANEPLIFSYHYAYKDYLDDNNYIDVI